MAAIACSPALTLYGSALARTAALEELCRKAPGGAVWTDGHVTFAQYLAQLDRRLPESGASKRLVEGAARDALLIEAWRSAEGAASIEPAPAAVESAGRLIASWKGAGVRPKDVQRAAKRVPARLSARLAFIGRLYEAYEGLLGTEWTDREGWEEHAVDRLMQTRDSIGLEPEDSVAARGVLRLVPIQRRVLDALRQRGHRVQVEAAVSLPPSGAQRDLPPLETLALSFGGWREEVMAEKAAPPAGIQRMEAPTPYAEVYAIAQRLRRWIVQEHVSPAQIAVTFRDLGPYSQAIGDVFQRLNIPYYERRGEPVAFQPIVRVALTALDAVRNGLDRASLFRFLQSGPVDLGGLTGKADVPAVHELHRLALDARIDRFHGADAAEPAVAWERRLNRYVGSLKERPAAESRARQAAAILVALIQRMQSLHKPRSRCQHAEEWRRLWRDAGLTAPRLAEHTLAHPEALVWTGVAGREREALAQLEDALVEASTGPGAERGHVTLADFAMLLERAVAARSVRTCSRERSQAVRILSLYDLRGLRFERVVLGGMVEGQFPAGAAADPILGDGAGTTVRQAFHRVMERDELLTQLEPRLAAEHRDEERALLELACRAASGGELLVTRSLVNAAGDTAGPSIFWDEPQFRGAVPTHAAPVHPAPPLLQGDSAEEAELRMAWVLGGGGEDETIRQAEAVLAATVALPPSARWTSVLDRAAVEHARGEALGGAPSSAADSPVKRQTPDESYCGALGLTAPEAPQRLQALYLAPPENSVPPPGIRALSPSALERFSSCAFRFLVEDVYRVDETQEPEDDLSALDRGSLWHEILARFYGEQLEEARRDGRIVACLDPARRTEYNARLETLSAQAFQQAPERYFTGRPGLWRIQRDRIRSGLGGWLRQELDEAADEAGFHCASVEWSFGAQRGADAPALAVSVSIDGGPRNVFLHGRIDRLDLRLADPGAQRPVVQGLRVVDYKAGRRSAQVARVRSDEVEALRSAQLPVYLAAALEWLRARESARQWRVEWDQVLDSSDAILYALADLPLPEGQGGSSSVSLFKKQEDPVTLRGLLAPDGERSLYRILSERVRHLVSGRFVVLPEACAGTGCRARLACRYRDVPDDSGAGGRAE